MPKRNKAQPGRSPERGARGAPHARAEPWRGEPSGGPASHSRRQATERDQPPEPQRIQKFLSSAGVASRRKVEELIRDGRITVNGEPAYIGQAVRPSDRIAVNGRTIVRPRAATELRGLAYKKRVGEVVTRADPDGRRTVFRKLPKLDGGRWIAIGRLDINTSGLLLFTNSGELARRLMHPSFEVEREYAVRVLGEVDEAMLQRLARGVQLDDGPARFEKVWRSDGPGPDDEEGGEGAANRWFQVVVRQGRNRLVRRLWESQGCTVSRLIRVRYGPIELGRGIRSASYRELSPAELRALAQSVGLSGPKA